MATSLVTKTIFEAVDRLTDPVKRMGGALSRFTNKAVAGLTKVDRAQRKLTAGFKKMTGVVGGLGLAFGGLMIGQTILDANVQLDSSLASLSAITGVAGKEFEAFRQQIDKVAESQTIFKGDIAKVFELMASAKPELLSDAAALGEVSKAAIILSKAGGITTVDAVNSMAMALNQFGADAKEAATFTDILATMQQKGSAPITYMSQALVNAGSTAKSFGVSFKDTTAILGGFAKAGIPASMAGTQMAGILSKLSKVQKKEFNPQFTSATDIIKNLSKAGLSYSELIKLTDTEGAKWLATIIAQNDEVQRLSGTIIENDAALLQANTRTDTLQNKWTELIDTFKNAVTSTDANNKSLNTLKKVLVFVTDNMDTILKVITIGIGVFVAFKTVLGLATAAQWLFNVAAGANPIGLIVIAITALIYLLYQVINNWDEWRGRLKMMFPLFSYLIDLIDSFKRGWQMVNDAFSKEGISGGLKAIGRVLLDAVLAPIQEILSVLSKLPGVGDKFKNLNLRISKFRKELIVNTSDNTGKSTNVDMANNKSIIEKVTSTNNNVNLNIKDETGRAQLYNPNNVPNIKLESVLNFGS